MPSPIIHVAFGCLIYRSLRSRIDGVRPGLLWSAVALSVLPDIDAAVGILGGDLGAYHNDMMSSPAFAFLVAAAVGAIGWWRGSEFRFWFILAIACYLIHILLDYLTVGGGVMLLWPLSEAHFGSPIALFYGLHRSDGWISIRHLYTVVSEFATLLVIWLVLGRYEKICARRSG
jgi:membrane-bound metal-dependent hydrolase YbcI (DUF457 family)